MRRSLARQPKRLTARTVATTKKLGRHADGSNLYLISYILYLISYDFQNRRGRLPALDFHVRIRRQAA